MPLHIHPILRKLEVAEEKSGLILKLDSAGYTLQKNSETSGLIAEVVPVATTWWAIGPGGVPYNFTAGQGLG